ncbi:MAG TPA: alpha/beta hydrolase [Candidatus Limnocylindrales bacterium]|nr:alpha/beta hydrolase [Candidatus Limnocylindrales bacterium]
MTRPEPPDLLAALGSDVTDHRLTRPDGRIVAWSESGVAGGRPILRVPGTPGSRLTLRADRSAWLERGLRVITTERPGFGASSRLGGRSFIEHSDDTAAILDELGIDTLPVYGGSGASPHILDFAARHPERIQAATIVVGAAPLDATEAAEMIEVNALGYRLFHEGRFEELLAMTSEIREAILADPLGSFRDIMATAPDADRAILEDPGWQRGFVIGVSEALRQGPGGWYDEDLAVEGPWGIDFGAIAADVTWWHGDGDSNAPLSAARRVVAGLASARLHFWPEAGHLTPYHHEPEILDELLARSG